MTAAVDAPALLAQLTDPHIRVGPGDRDPADKLAAAVRAVRALEPLPHAVLVTGDLTEHATGREYDRVKELLGPLELPLHVLPGNHDDRDALRACFALDDPAARSGDPVQYVAWCGDLRIVVCDTTIPGRGEGAYDAPRRAWLETQLLADRQAPTLLAMHHPPMTMGVPPMDELGIDPGDRAALAELLARFPNVRRIVAGHVHRTAVGALGTVPVLALSSAWAQIRLQIGAPEYELTGEPAAIALHALIGPELVSHVQPVAGP